MNCPNCDQIVTFEPGSPAGKYDDGYPPEIYCDACGWPDNIEEESEHSTDQSSALDMYAEWYQGEKDSKY